MRKRSSDILVLCMGEARRDDPAGRRIARALSHVHRYHATCHWTGDTTIGYESYDRTHTSSAPPARTELTLSADPSFLGDPRKLNPEQLVVLATSS